MDGGIEKLKRKYHKHYVAVSEVLCSPEGRTQEFWDKIWPRMIDAEVRALEDYSKKSLIEHEKMVGTHD